MIFNVFSWIGDLVLNRNNDTLVGLSQLKSAPEPVQEFHKIRKNKDIKLSDLMKRESY